MSYNLNFFKTLTNDFFSQDYPIYFGLYNPKIQDILPLSLEGEEYKRKPFKLFYEKMDLCKVTGYDFMLMIFATEKEPVYSLIKDLKEGQTLDFKFQYKLKPSSDDYLLLILTNIAVSTLTMMKKGNIVISSPTIRVGFLP